MNELIRPSLYWNIATTEARKRMSYRADFWINALGAVAVNYSVYWSLTYALFHSSGQTLLGGFTMRGMVVYYIFAVLIGRFVQSNELQLGIPDDIYQGSLTRYLLYPVSYPAVKYAEQVGSLFPQLMQLIVLGTSLPFLIGIPPEIHISLSSIAMCAVSLMIANFLHFWMAFPVQSVAFWADNVWSLMVAERLLISILGGLMLPLSLFPEWARNVLAWLPFPYLFSLPVRTLIGSVGPAEWAKGIFISAAWCGIFAFAGRLVWRRGDRQYTGVGI
jgi:ABC-2 type transport system permease protein